MWIRSREFGDEAEDDQKHRTAEAFVSTNMSDHPSSSDAPHPHLNSSNSVSSHVTCFRSKDSVIIFSMFSVAYFFLLLSCFLFFWCLGFHQRRKRRPKPSMSHSDHFTFQTLGMQLTEFLGFVLFFSGGYTNSKLLLLFGVGSIAVTSTGQALLHLCTCLERYLAVVHPIVYLGLRPSSRIRIRNVTIGCIWLQTFGWMVIYSIDKIVAFILYFTILIISLVLVFVCSILVLQVLKRSGPGKEGGGREQGDQAKLRAFRTIMIILGVLGLRFTGSLLCNVAYTLRALSPINNCVMPMYSVWFSVPSVLMTLLLFLNKERKLQCCTRHTETGE